MSLNQSQHVLELSMISVVVRKMYVYDSFNEARKLQYLDWYNRSRPHSKLEKKTPDEAYAVMLPTVKMAA